MHMEDETMEDIEEPRKACSQAQYELAGVEADLELTLRRLQRTQEELEETQVKLKRTETELENTPYELQQCRYFVRE